MSFYLVVIVDDSEAFIIADDGNYTFATGIGIGGFGIGVLAIFILLSILRIFNGIGLGLRLPTLPLRAAFLLCLCLGNHPQGSSELLSVNVTI